MRLPVPLLCLTLAGAAVANGAPPDSAKPARKAAAIIDDHYLDAKSNPAWKAAKHVLGNGRYASPAAAYRAIGRQLATLNDSDLHLFSPVQRRRVEDALAAKRTGTGLLDFGTDRDPATGEARVVTALGGSPAARAGIAPRDCIVSIDRRPTRAMTHDQVIDALAGAGRGSVRVAVRHESRIRVVNLAPSPAAFEPVEYSRHSFRGKTIGYIRVLLFTAEAGQKVREAVSDLERGGASGFVLDLRNDPGGLLDSARTAAGAFVNGVLGREVPNHGPAKDIETTGVSLTGKPLVILIDGGTASAAEFVAAALHDLHRAVLVGSPSYGRGRAQTYYPLSDGYGILVPTAQLQTATGRTFIPGGIHPDVAVPGDLAPEAEIATPRDAQFMRGLAVLLGS